MKLFRSDWHWPLVEGLSKRLSAHAMEECAAGGHAPFDALASGGMYGKGYMALKPSEGIALGAWGWTRLGTIWSLWADLSPEEALQIYRLAPGEAQRMLAESGQPRLYNAVPSHHKETLRWVEHAGFSIGEPDLDIGLTPIWIDHV